MTLGNDNNGTQRREAVSHGMLGKRAVIGLAVMAALFFSCTKYITEPGPEPTLGIAWHTEPFIVDRVRVSLVVVIKDDNFSALIDYSLVIAQDGDTLRTYSGQRVKWYGVEHIYDPAVGTPDFYYIFRLYNKVGYHTYDEKRGVYTP